MDPEAFPLVGYLAGRPLYQLSIGIDAYQRLVLLTREGVEGLPDWLDWGQPTVRSQRMVATTDPTYFTEQENFDGQGSYHSGHPTGFSKL